MEFWGSLVSASTLRLRVERLLLRGKFLPRLFLFVSAAEFITAFISINYGKTAAPVEEFVGSISLPYRTF